MTDAAVIGLVLDGYTHAFSELVDRYRDEVFGMAVRFSLNQSDAQDISQEIFIKVFKNLHKYNGASKFSTWLYKLSYNQCIDWVRKNRRHYASSNIELEEFEIADCRAGPEDELLEKQKRETLRKAVYELKDKYRNILILFYYQSLSYEDISEILSMPVKTVETQLYRARQQLRKKLAGELTGGDQDEMP
jgi:RNA polymerase sigma-70 factor (ECF subfamily)